MRTKELKILNPDLKEDYHIHSLNYSDGMNTVDEIVCYAGKIGLKKIMITDHSDLGRRGPLSYRKLSFYYKNVHNDVEVLFGIEADVLNRKGDIADSIRGHKSDRLILSAHMCRYQDDPSTLTQAFLNAIQKNKEQIFCIGHLHIGNMPDDFDAKSIIDLANELNIPIELNASYFEDRNCNFDIFHLILDHADTVVINSDAHALFHIGERTKRLKKYLQEKSYMK